MDDDIIRAQLLYALARKRKWGESHTAYENLFRQFDPSAMGKHGMKIAKAIVEKLFRDDFLIKKPTGYGLQVSLNPRKSQEIKKIISEKLGFEIK